MTTANQIKSGYLHPRYVQSLAEFGQPYHLPRCDGWLLRRGIPGSDRYDAMGPYPLFSCADWSALGDDLDAIVEGRNEFADQDKMRRKPVSVVAVMDPFAAVAEADFQACFDRVLRFKDHYVARMDRPIEQIVKKSHRATVRRALRHVEVELCPKPEEYLDEWVALFANLVQRHNIRGLRAFSREAFATQLAIPGMVMFAARAAGELVGLDLWYVQNDVAYGHLVAFSETGYRLRASYATKWHLMDYFRDKVQWIDFGGGSGLGDRKPDGLSIFKQGWSTETRPVYLCARTIQPGAYRELTRARSAGETNYFPAYRHGEFA